MSTDFNQPKFMDRVRELADDVVANLMTGLSRGAKRLRRLVRTADGTNHKKASQMLERGRSHYNKKDYAKAEEYFHKAVRLDARYGLAHYYLGLARYKQNNLEDAYKSWYTVIQVDPTSDAASRAEKKIDLVKGRLAGVIDRLRSQTH